MRNVAGESSGDEGVESLVVDVAAGQDDADATAAEPLRVIDEHAARPATPLGSSRRPSRSRATRIASINWSSVTVTTSLTRRLLIAKVATPGDVTASPSAIVSG